MAKLGPLKVFGQPRGKIAPRKSILRAQGAIFEGTNDPEFDFNNLKHQPRAYNSNHTIDIGALSSQGNNQPRHSISRRSLGGAQQPALHDDSSEEESSDEGEVSMDLTMTAEEREREARRKSLAARRVSFAPNAHIRTFSPDKMTSQAIAALAAHNAALGIVDADEGSTSFTSQHSEESSTPSSPESTREGESMEMVGEDVTRAFAGHFAGTVIPVDALEDDENENLFNQQRDEDDDEEDDSADGPMEMDEATGEITRAFASQGAAIFNSQQQPEEAAKSTKPRFSEVVRREDAEDEELMRELGLKKPATAAASRTVGFGGVPSSEAESEEEDASMDDGVTMDMTTAIGAVIQTADDAHDDSDADESDESMMDQTTDMQDATMHGGILAATQVIPPVEPEVVEDAGVPTPSTASARLQAALFERQTMNGGSAPSINSITVPEPPRSPRRLSPSPQPQQAPVPPKSPARARVSLAPPKSPAQPKISSPLKKSYVPSSDSAAPSTPPRPITAPSTPAKSPRAVSRPVTTPRSASRVPTTPRSASKVAFGTAITPRDVFAPRVAPVPASVGRSPGGSLSLRAAMSAPSPRKSLAGPAPIVVPAPVVVAPPRPVVEVIKAEVRIDDEDDEEDETEDMTSSSYGFEAEPVELAPLSLEDFVSETGVGFHRDIVGLAGLDLSSGTSSTHKLRRMSLAPPRAKGSAALSAPPSLAELAVAGGCKSLFHQLYTANQSTLEETIRQTAEDLAAWEQAMSSEPPVLFAEWQRASAAHREVMKAQFRDIKTFYYLRERVEWNDYRRGNYESIIEIMEENLAGLHADEQFAESLTMEDVLPELEQRREQLLKELLDERARDLELSACDQEELKERQAEVAELTAVVEGFDAERGEVEGQLNALRAKTADLRLSQDALVSEAEEMQRKLDEGRRSTKAEVFRLQGEFEALQDLHSWKLVRFDAQGVTLSHFDQFEITVQLAAGGRVLGAQLAMLPEQKSKTSAAPPALAQLNSTLSLFLFNKLAAHVDAFIGSSEQPPHVKLLLHRIAALWTNARRIKSEAHHAHLRHPIALQLVGLPDRNQELILHAEVHSPAFGSTVFVKFELTGEELVAEEGADDNLTPAPEDDVLGRVGSDVKVKFARGGAQGVDTETLKYLVRERLDSGERGAFVGACDDVERRMAEWAASA